MPSKLKVNRSHFWTWSLVAVACIAALVGTYILCVEAPPPRKLVIATGSQDGAYYRFARQYQELLEKEGVTLEIRATRGTVENLQLLTDELSDVSVAFVQTGIADPEESMTLLSLASLYREPLWIFYRGEKTIDQVTQLKGLRIAVGAEGSGTRGIALQLLNANGIGEEDNAELLEFSGSAAADALEQGGVDAAFFVAGIDAIYIQRLLRSQQARLVELNQIEAYERQFRFLSTVTIHRGLIDLKQEIPKKTIVMVAPAATLVAHRSMHPALVALLLKVATKVHRNGDLLSAAGEFPSPTLTDLPLSDDAERFFRVGPPVLQRILPFWLASIVDRMKVMIIPLVMLMMPLIRITPPLVRWQTRRRIYKWYGELRSIDQKAIHGMSVDEAREAIDELRQLEKQIAHVGVPLSYMEEYYNLRLHLNLVCSKVESLIHGVDHQGQLLPHGHPHSKPQSQWRA